jgi:hypothetical protein
MPNPPRHRFIDHHESTSHMDRREFLKRVGAAAAIAAIPLPSFAAEPTRPFEICGSVYAWDLHDEGVEKVLDNLQQMSGVNTIYLIGLMHPEKRPLTSSVYPHNPVRQTWTAEDARVYWHPDLKRYGRIKPRLSDFDWLNQTDWANTLITAARKRGMRVGIELSHTLVDKQRAEGEFADLAERNVAGEITHGRTWLRPICPNHSDTREYALALMSDLTANYDIDFIMSCIINFDEGGPEKGGCFCPACVKAAQATGVNLEKIRLVLAANPTAQPELNQWQQFRFESTGRFYKFLHDGIIAIKPGMHLRYNLHMNDPIQWGVDLKIMQPHLDSLRIMDYTEQQGAASAMPQKRKWLTEIRQQLGKEFPIVSSIATRPKATPDLIRQGVGIAIECGMNGITLAHYDGADFDMLKAIREGVIAGGIKM